MSALTNICIFCSRDCDREELCESKLQKTQTKTLQQFVKLVERYLETSFLPQTANRNVEDGVLEACPDCLIVVESFCSVYHKWKCLEMELQWRLRQLSNAMNSSGGRTFDSRLSAQCNNEDSEFNEVLKKFRTDFQQKCMHNFSKSFPRVSLNRWKGLPSKQGACHLNNEAGADFNQLFLGWVSTLAVVFQLGLGNSVQQSNEVHYRSGGHNHIQISECCDDVDDDEQFEQVQNRENLSSCGGAREIGFFASSDNQFALQNTPEVELESSEFKRPSSKPKLKIPKKIKTRERMGLHKFSFTASHNQRHDLPTKSPFKCFCCSKNFSSFSQLKCHQRAFTHILMKRKLLDKQVHHKLSRRTKRQSKNTNKIKVCSAVTNENVGVLRPLRKTTKPNSVMDDSDGSSQDDEQDSFANKDDDWNMSSSDDDTSSSSFGSISNSSSSESMSSDEEEERPCSSTPKRRVPGERYACNIDSCVQSFYFKEELDDHLQLHGSFPCSLCDVVEEYAPDLALHESDHMKQTKTEDQAEQSEKKRKKSRKVVRYCARCSFSTNERFRYIIHYLKTHLKVPPQRIKCRICEAWTEDRKRITWHMKNSRRRKVDRATTHHCKQCAAYFNKELQLLKHQKRHPRVKKENKYFCEMDSCNAGFVTEPELVVHKRLHGSFSCKFCHSVVNHAENLAIHELTHRQSEREGSKYSCPRCPVHTNCKQTYVSHFAWNHLKLRSGTDPCSICQTPLLTNISKRIHFLRHHDIRGVDPNSVKKCKECPAYFLRRKQLQSHKKEIHSGQSVEASDISSDEEKRQTAPGKCADCGSFFVRSSTLEKHKENCKKKEINTKVCTKKFPCEVGSCKHSFDFKEELEIHQKHHGQFSCQFCKVVKTFAPKLVIHELIHAKCKSDKTHLYCARCNYKLSKRKGSNAKIVNHYLKQHIGLPLQRVMCSICKIMLTKTSLSRHHLTYHNVKGVDLQSIQKCEQCDAYFLKNSQLTEHIKNSHDLRYSASKLAKADHSRKYCNVSNDCRKMFESEEDLENHRKLHGKFTCSFCPVVENYAPKLALHETTHIETSSVKRPRHRGQPYSCSRCTSIIHGRFHYVEHFLETHMNLPSDGVTCQNCGEKYSVYKELTKHCKAQHEVTELREEQVARCDKCPAFFVKQMQLVSHRKKRHGEDYLTCVDCKRKFTNPCVLRNHRTVVHKKKESDFLLACDVPSCERRFERKAELEWHKDNTHEGKGKDNSLVCDKCGKKCSTKAALATHIKIHGEENATLKKRVEPRRFVCEECGNAFNSRQTLEVHQMTHTGPASWKWGCLFCGKRCLTEQGLQVHLTAHTKEKPYICGTCGVEYAHGKDLRNHRNKKHNANEQPLPRRAVNARVSKKGQKLPPRLWE